MKRELEIVRDLAQATASRPTERDADAGGLRRRGFLGLIPAFAVSCAPSSARSTASAPSAAPSSLEARMNEVVVRAVDTAGSLAPRVRVPREIRLGDLVAFHGHPCDGLFIAARAISLGLFELFGDAPVDRTDMAGATNASVCYGDVLAYLTGARHRYGSLVVDAGLGDQWHLLRRSTGAAVRVALRPGVKPARLVEQEAAARAAACPAEIMADVATMQRELALRVWDAPPKECFEVERVAYGYEPGKLRGDVGKRDCPATTEPAR